MKKNLTVEDLKRIQLSLLRELDRYCKEHDDPVPERNVESVYDPVGPPRFQ